MLFIVCGSYCGLTLSILYVMHNAFNVCGSYCGLTLSILYVMQNAFNVCDFYCGLYVVSLFYTCCIMFLMYVILTVACMVSWS